MTFYASSVFQYYHLVVMNLMEGRLCSMLSRLVTCPVKYHNLTPYYYLCLSYKFLPNVCICTHVYTYHQDTMVPYKPKVCFKLYIVLVHIFIVYCTSCTHGTIVCLYASVTFSFFTTTLRSVQIYFCITLKILSKRHCSCWHYWISSFW